MYHDVIGVLGGMGSFATLHFFEELLNAFPAEKEWDRPRIIIDNRCTMPSRVLAVLQGVKYDQLVTELCDSVNSLINSGATKIVLACNTSHLFLDEIYKNIPSAKGIIISIIDACCDEIVKAGEKEISLIASEGTIESKVFANALIKKSIQVSTPVEEQFLLQRELIEAVKQNIVTDDTINKFIEFINSFAGDALILGCTEFPVLYSRVPSGTFNHIRVYDPLLSVIEVLKKECK